MTDEFWDYLDQLVSSNKMVIDRPKGSVHPRYNGDVYPLDYGFLENTVAGDGGGLDIWVGSKREKKIEAIMCTVDLFKRDVELKILIGCSDFEVETILNYQNTGSMRAMLIRR